MPLSAEQKKHLEQNWQNIQMRSNEEAAANQNELLSLAAKKNAAAIPIAYSEAALHRLELNVRNQLDWTLVELDAMGIIVDREVERFVVQHFNAMTSMSMPLHFPPGITSTMDVSAHQGAHARARMRLNNKLQREASSAIRSLALRSRPSAPVPAVVINNHFHNSPGARSYYQSTDKSVNIGRAPEELAALIANLSHGHLELEAIATQIQRAPDKKTRAEQIVKWISAVSTVEALWEKVHAALPALEAWIRHLSA